MSVDFWLFFLIFGYHIVNIIMIWNPKLRRVARCTSLSSFLPHKTGSTSVRVWLRKVSAKLEVESVLTPRYPNKPTEDHHRRLKNWELSECSFIGGHLRANPVNMRSNELSLGSVISRIRDPHDLFASKYFHLYAEKWGSLLMNTVNCRLRMSN